MKNIKERFYGLIEFIPFHSCWEWRGTKYGGYGKFMFQTRKPKWAHRFSYESHKGGIPKGLHIDHLCSNRGCVNPQHLEAVSQKENNYRSKGFGGLNHKKTHCPKGHAYTKRSIQKNGYRKCLECHRVRENLRYHSK